MAKNPQKSKDATQEALSAIEDALNNRGPEPSTSPPLTATRNPAPAVADLFPEDEKSGEWEEDDSSNRRRPANDDRAAMGAILQTLQRRPQKFPYFVATGFSAAWIAGGLGFAILNQAALQAVLSQPAGALALFGIALGFLIPVVLAFVLAHLVGRTRDMRLIAQSMAEVAMRLSEPETAARESVVNVGQAIRREVAAMGDGVERTLARAGELEALVHNEVSALERSYNDNEIRIRSLLTELTSQRDTLVAQAEQVRNAIASVHLDLSHDITSVGDLVADKVNDVAQRITRTLTEKGEHITLALGHAGDSMIDALSERGSNLLDRLETASESTTTAVSNASERLTASLNFKTDHVQEEFAQLSVRLQQMMTNRLEHVAQNFAQRTTAVVEQMSTQSDQLTSAIVNTGTQMAENIVARVEEVNSTLRSTGDSLVLDLSLRGGDVVSKMEQTGSRITDTIVARSNAVSETFRDNAETLVQAFNNRGDNLKDMLATRLQNFEQLFSQGGTELAEKINRDSTTLGNLITRHITEFDRTVKTYGGELVERLGARTNDISEAMRNYVDSFENRVGAKTVEIGATLDKRLSEFEGNLGARVGDIAVTLSRGGEEVVSTLDKRIAEAGNVITARGEQVAADVAGKIENIDQTLGARATEVANTLDSRIGRFEDLLVGRVETVTSQVETRSKAAAEALNARMEQLSQSIKSNASEAEKALSQLTLSSTDSIRHTASDVERTINTVTAGASATLKDNASEVEKTLLNVSAEVAKSFVGKADEIASEVSRRASEMTAVLDQNTGGVLASLTDKSQQFSAEITKATEIAVKSIEEKGISFSKTMLDNSEEIARVINKAGEDASGAVTKTITDLQAVAQSAIEQSKQTANSTVSEMLETHGMLRSDTTALFERLREANIMLQEVLSGAHENMSALEHTMMTRVAEFVTAMNEVTKTTGQTSSRIEDNIAGFRDVTSRVIGDLGQLTAQIEGHGRELAKAAELIDRSNQHADATIADRRASFDSLLATLDIRTDDLDQRLRRFSGLLDESLEAASARARDIARIVSEASASGAHAIADQFDQVRIAAEDERRRTSEAMRATYEQATGESQAMFAEASERFVQIMQGLKGMSAQMQHELEITRTELRRGFTELPQETAESAAQMRRVIVDQIEALAELNRIVARHGRSLDSVEPPRRSQREEPPAREMSPRARERAEAQRNSEGAGSYAPPSARRSERAEARNEQPASTLTPAQGNQARSGWLTDLLNRASREEGGEQAREQQNARQNQRNSEDRPARHSIESLDSLSVDIARMIDHDAAADLWDRYKRGDRNVFTRRLYTLQGQKAFDEIRQKYRADREFKQTVDRYIAEFERLLEEVSRDDRGQVMARTYLTSETGKVYTMLAHAAGRFDQ